VMTTPADEDFSRADRAVLAIMAEVEANGEFRSWFRLTRAKARLRANPTDPKAIHAFWNWLMDEIFGPPLCRCPGSVFLCIPALLCRLQVRHHGRSTRCPLPPPTTKTALPEIIDDLMARVSR
jgi:hypothetical protein